MNIVLGIMLAILSLYTVMAIKGPTKWDRLLIMNLISTKIIVIIILFAAVNETTFLLDFAIIYALSGFIGTIFLALFLSGGDTDKKREKK